MGEEKSDIGVSWKSFFRGVFCVFEIYRECRSVGAILQYGRCQVSQVGCRSPISIKFAPVRVF